MDGNAAQSPISPGRSWYEDSCRNRPTYSTIDGDIACDVVIIGGGFCGLSAALKLAESGTSVVLLEAHRIGDGASGRNGGQMGSGQRAGVLELEKELGYERAKALWDMAEDAKHSLLNVAEKYNFDSGYQKGQLTPMHKRRFETNVREEVEVLNGRYGYGEIEYLNQIDMASALGSSHYFGGSRDLGTGHIHPMKYCIGLAKAAVKAGQRFLNNPKQLKSTGMENIQLKPGTER